MVDDCCNAGTHDIMDILLSSYGNNLEVVMTFVAGFTARGAVMNCASVNESGEINIYKLCPSDSGKNQQHCNNLF